MRYPNPNPPLLEPQIKSSLRAMTIEEALAIVETVLEGRLNKVQVIVFQQSWEEKSYLQIAMNSGYDVDYIKDVGSKIWQLLSRAFEEKVTKYNFRSILKRRSGCILAGKSPNASVEAQRDESQAVVPTPEGMVTHHHDWGEAIDVDLFFGRTEELAILGQWIVEEHCRLVILSGMGGIGKTALTAKLAEQIQDQFDYLIWRSLRNAPPVEDILVELLQFLSNTQETNLPATLDGKISQLVNYLRQHRCLLVLDNAESILRSGDQVGHYREGYQGYGQLLRWVGETRHQSCLVLTSREKPRGLSSKEGKTLPIRSLQLTGLQPTDAHEIVRTKGLFSGSTEEWTALAQHYASNPLALKIASVTIQELFNGSISKFLEQGTVIFGDIFNLLNQQFERLSDLEKQVMYWLAIDKESVSLLELREKIVSPISQGELLEVLESLQQRSLIEKSGVGFSQPPFIMEYVTERLNRVFYKQNLRKNHGQREISQLISQAF